MSDRIARIEEWRAHWIEQGVRPPSEHEARVLRLAFGELQPQARKAA